GKLAERSEASVRPSPLCIALGPNPSLSLGPRAETCSSAPNICSFKPMAGDGSRKSNRAGNVCYPTCRVSDLPETFLERSDTQRTYAADAHMGSLLADQQNKHSDSYQQGKQNTDDERESPVPSI